MKTKSNFSHRLFVATVMIVLAALVFSGCPNDSSSSDSGGTITVRLINASGTPNGHVFAFGVFNVGEDPFGDTPLAGGDDIVASDTAEAVAEDGGAAVVFNNGNQYDIYAFVDLDDSGPELPNTDDYTGGPFLVDVDGNTTKILDYGDFTAF